MAAGVYGAKATVPACSYPGVWRYLCVTTKEARMRPKRAVRYTHHSTWLHSRGNAGDELETVPRNGTAQLCRSLIVYDCGDVVPSFVVANPPPKQKGGLRYTVPIIDVCLGMLTEVERVNVPNVALVRVAYCVYYPKVVTEDMQNIFTGYPLGAPGWVPSVLKSPLLLPRAPYLCIRIDHVDLWTSGRPHTTAYLQIPQAGFQGFRAIQGSLIQSCARTCGSLEWLLIKINPVELKY